MSKKPRFETVAIQSTEDHFKGVRPATTPIYMSSTYIRNEDGTYNEDMIYGRANNPNRAILEYSVAQLEGGARGFAFGSGMAAISAVLQCLSAGDHVLLPHDIYFGAKNLTAHVLGRWGLQVTAVNMADLPAVESAITPKTKLIWLESPSNPLLQITDLSALISLAQAHGLLTAVDNTWPTPVLTRPIELGADIVVHSTTKYFGGHSDVIGGCVVLAKDDALAERMAEIQHLGGGVPSPFDCWLVTRGIRTLSLRMKAHCESAMKIAAYLAQHPRIERVLYPGLPEDSGHAIAKKQMIGGFGGMISVLVKGDSKKALEISNRLRYFTSATSLGGVESLVEHRRSVEGPASNAPDNLLRLSIGLEHVDDLLEDWEQALSH